MLVAAAIRNLDDATGLVGLSQRTIDDLGGVALSLFLVLALMTLRAVGAGRARAAAHGDPGRRRSCWWRWSAVWPIFRLMGRDYEAAVMSGGFIGFMLGHHRERHGQHGALVQRYGPAPQAFLVVPMVGAFFIDFTNALIITVFLNLIS